MNKENILGIFEIINDTKDIIESGWKSERKKNEFAELNTDTLEKINSEINSCHLCELGNQRDKTVPGEGVIRPLVMFIGEGPGAEEDKTGVPFIGKAGQYLDKWLAAIELDRKSDCFIGNIVKCRPPGNRDPLPEEILACKPYLVRQLRILKPKVIVSLGRFASQFICQSQEGINRLRGRIYYYEDIPVIPTFHPSAVLRNPGLRQDVWSDLQAIKKLLNELH